MRPVPYSTIEQWSVLRAVVEHGGFAQAAAALHRSQSSVSYAVTKLQETLNVKLLELKGRRAVLTMAGAALLAEASPLIDELARIEERSQAVASGEGVRIRLLVDTVFPKDRLFNALHAFTARHPHVDIHLRETVRQTMRETRDEDFDIAVLIAEPGARLVEVIADVQLIAVAHADHPLARSTRAPNKALLSRYARVEIGGMEAVPGMATETGKIWRMNTVEAAIEAVRRGLCYGWLPYHLIAEELHGGSLAPLLLKVGNTRHIPLGLLFEEDGSTIGRSVTVLASLLAANNPVGGSELDPFPPGCTATIIR